MDMFSIGGVMHGGTFNGHPACMAALVATLTELAKGETFAKLSVQGQRLMRGIAAALDDAGIQARVDGFPQIFHVAFREDRTVTDYRTSLRDDRARYIRFTEALHWHGVRALERGAWFLSAAHTSDDIDETVAAVSAVAKTI